MQFKVSCLKKLSTLNIARNRRFSTLNMAVLAAFCSILLFGACEAMGDAGGVLGIDTPAGSEGATYTIKGSVKTSDNRADVLDSIVLRLKADGKNIKLASPESNGKYAIAGVPEGAYTLTASHFDYEAQTVDLLVTGNVTVPEILLVAKPDSGPKYAVSGTVSLSGGAGSITDVKVEIENLDTESGAIARVNSSGAYTFNVPEGRYSIVASLDGYVPRSTGNVLVPQNVPDGGNVPDMALQAQEPTYTAGGTVSLFDVSNNPVAIVPTGAAVLFTDTVTGFIQAAHPLPSGKYSVSGLSGGLYRVEAVLAGYGQTTTVTQSIQADKDNINIQLKADGAPPPVYYTVSGSISTSDSNADISEAFAALTQGGVVKAVGAVQANGDYTIPNVEADSGYNIKVSHPGYMQTAIADFDVSANVTGKNITLTQIIPPAYTVSGTVALADGGATGNVTVSLKKVGSGTAFTVSPSGTGGYSFTGVEAGDYTVKAALDGYHAAETSSFNVNTNATAPNLTLDVRKFSIGGKVTLNRGSGTLASVSLTLKAGGTTAGTKNPAANGDYKFENLLAGDYTIEASLTDYTPYVSNPISVQNANMTGQNIVLNAIGLPPLTGSVTISGTAGIGETLTADTTSLGGTGAIFYQWIRGASTNIGTNASTYIPVAADVGSTIKVTVIRTGYSGEVTSPETAAVTQPALTGTVSISGSLFAGQPLTADTTLLGGSGALSYQWIRGSTDIGGANGSKYNAAAADIGSTIKVSVTREGYLGSVESAAVTIAAPVVYTATADGSDGAASSKIDFVFNATVTGLTAANIAISGGAATKGGISGSGTAWSLALTTVNTAGAATVTINKAGIESGARSITLYKSPVVNAASKDLSIKFGITTAGITNTAEVTATFNKVHAYLATNPAVDTATLTTAADYPAYMPAGLATIIGDIKLGDYIDLVSLSITGYPLDYYDELAPGHGKINATNTQVSGTGASGKLLRLIVVGINSFNENQGGSYTGSGNGTDPHLVFQFQNVPVKHRMNDTDDNSNVNTNQMRTYLDGNFLTGLTAAGVPDSLIWAPKRYVSGGGSGATAAELCENKLWLPTELEIRGLRTYSSSTYENDTNQARLAYYNSNSSRIKSNGSAAQSYWMASPYYNSSTSFCSSNSEGYSTIYYPANSSDGCAPAFCIK